MIPEELKKALDAAYTLAEHAELITMAAAWASLIDPQKLSEAVIAKEGRILGNTAKLPYSEPHSTEQATYTVVTTYGPKYMPPSAAYLIIANDRSRTAMPKTTEQLVQEFYASTNPVTRSVLRDCIIARIYP